MNNELTLYHNILFLELRPWMNRSTAEAKYKTLLQEIKKEHFSIQPNYEVDFSKPLTSKRKYYYSLIENEATRYLNNFHGIMEGANDKEKKYWVHTTLTKVIAQKLKETSAVITDNQYLLGQKTTDKNLLDETYIIQLVKYQLIRIYMEIQETFPEYLKEEAVTEDELHQLYFSEQAPEKSLLIPAEKIKLATPASKVNAKHVDIELKVLKNDFREVKKGVLDYKTIVKNPQRFASFEEQLFLNEYIDTDYNFTNKHGQIQELAAIFHVLINKGYFSPKDFTTQKTLKALDYRKFLDHRYQAGTDKQFRTLGNQQEKVAEFLENNSWLERLPTS